jgi:FG-GAP-like repeat/FG-GAP repeat
VVDHQVWSGAREGSCGLGQERRLSARRFFAAVGGEGRRSRTAVIATAVGLSLVLASTASAAVSFSRKDYRLPEGTWTNGGGTAPRSEVLTPAALVDFNGDGKRDIAIANGYTGKVVVLLNQGHGTFAPAPGSPFFACMSNSIVSDIVAGQLNLKKDHHADVAVTCEVEGGVWRLLGNGHGALGPPVAVSPNNAVGPLLVGHLSTDAYGDLVYMNVSSPYEWPCLAPLDGSGGVRTANCFQEDYTHAAAPLVLWRFHPNACSGGEEMLGFGYDTGDAHWAWQDAEYNSLDSQGPCGSPFHTSGYGHDSGIAYSSNLADPSPSGIATGDLNGDGTPDVVMADSGGAFHVALSHSGGFPAGEPPSKFISAGPIASIRVADFNGDHHLDIAAAEYDPTGVHRNWVAIHLGKTSTFGAAQKFGVAGIQTNIDELPKVTVGDLNGDGKPDIVSVAGHAGVVTVLLNTTH